MSIWYVEPLIPSAGISGPFKLSYSSIIKNRKNVYYLESNPYHTISVIIYAYTEIV